MSDNHTELQLQQQQRALALHDDGWDDTAAEEATGLVRGPLIRFQDWKYYVGKQRTALPDGYQLIALAVMAVWQRWENGKVVQSIPREPGKFLPARETLSYPDEAGKPNDPWANTRLVYFVHPVSAAIYTFSTRSGGGRSAVSTLAGAIKRMRAAHPHAVPVVELRAEEMETQYGLKSKPKFEIVDWKFSDIAEAVVPQEQRQLTSADDDFGNGNGHVDRNLNDSIPY